MLLHLLPKLVRDLRVLIREVMDLIVLAYIGADRMGKLMDKKRNMLFLRARIDNDAIVLWIVEACGVCVF